MKARVAAVIPALNEEETVALVVKPLVESPLVDEVIVVSDGSTDDTAEVAKRAGARVVELKESLGKGAAMLKGVTHTDAQVLLFLDADLFGLTQDHVERLLLPVLSGSRMMNVGLRERKIVGPVMAHLPLISGLRAMRRHVIEQVPKEFLQGFMVEASMNFFCKKNGFSYGTVSLGQLEIRRKYEKVGWLRGGLGYIKMTVDVLKAMFVVRAAHLFGQV